MAIHVRFFASLREQMGASDKEISSDGILTVTDVWASVSDRPLPDSILYAVNMDYAESMTAVKDGDEVAFFPPVTGGGV